MSGPQLSIISRIPSAVHIPTELKSAPAIHITWHRHCQDTNREGRQSQTEIRTTYEVHTQTHTHTHTHTHMNLMALNQSRMATSSIKSEPNPGSKTKPVAMESMPKAVDSRVHYLSPCKRSIDLTNNSTNILDEILGTDNVSDFAREHLSIRPCVLRGVPSRVSALIEESLYGLDVKTYLENTASDQIHVWLAPVNTTSTQATSNPNSGKQATKQSSKSTSKSNGNIATSKQTASSAAASATKGNDIKHDDSERDPNDCPKAPILNSITVEDPNQAYLLYLAGHSLYCRAPAELESAVIDRTLDALGIGVCSSGGDRFRRGEIETFFSRKGHITDFHSDFQENITIQVSGRKKWIFRSSDSVHPIRGCTPHFNSQAQGFDVVEQQMKTHRVCDRAFQADMYKLNKQVHAEENNRNGSEHEVILNPGDVLYHPAGIWHRVECVEDSISINISLIAMSYADIVCSGIQQLLWENPQWRRPVQTRPHTNNNECLQTMNSLLTSLASLLSQLKAKYFLPFAAVNATTTTEQIGQLQRLLKYNEVAAKDIPKDEASDSENGTDDSDDSEGSEQSEDEEDIEEEIDEDSVGMDNDEEDGSGSSSSISHLTKIFANQIPTYSEEFVDQMLTTLRFRVNPLTRVLRADKDVCTAYGLDPALVYMDADVRQQLISSYDTELNQDETPTPHVLIVHNCFGNDTLESVTRGLIYVPRSIVSTSTDTVVSAVLEKIRPKESLWVANTLSDTAVNGSMSDNKKRKRDEIVPVSSGCGVISARISISESRLLEFSGSEFMDSIDTASARSTTAASKKAKPNGNKNGNLTNEDPERRQKTLQLLLALLHMGALSVAN
jgi:quercetin dioxygenase-like cupin family protein